MLIITDQGNCDRAYRYPLAIRSGVVSYAGRNNFNISGRVQGNGAVSVRVSSGNQSANGTGRLAEKRGNGTWKAGNGQCSGRWRAERTG